MIVELIANGVCAFAGAVAFAVLFSVPRHFYIGCGITGAAGWCVYLILEEYAGLSAAIASFCGTLVVVLLSRMLTVRMKCPITIFLVSGAGCRDLLYNLLSGYEPVGNGSIKRPRSSQGFVWNSPWNCHCIIHSERCVPERLLEAAEISQKKEKYFKLIYS